ELRKLAYNAAFLRNRNEHARRNGAEIWVGPTRQRLEADGTAVLQVHDLLEMWLDLSGCHGPPQCLLYAGNALGGFFHFAGVDDHSPAPRTFGLVKRCLGLAQENICRLIPGIEK